ncbi:MAG: outer membrane protein assembly factor BamB family protein, partial [Mucilaginibacter sp.]
MEKTHRVANLLFIVCIGLICCNKLGAQTMFRGKADHNSNYSSGTNGFFNDQAWKFDADAPIRSTVAVAGDAVYFGSSKGIFYCLNKSTGKIKWIFNAGYAINSSAAYHNGNIFFCDNKQSIYSLNASTGKLNWRVGLGVSKNYDWAFDYLYSSPVIIEGHILTGSKDGLVYNLNEQTGAISWKFKTSGIVRSTPAVADNIVYIGDTDGDLFAIDLKTGRQKWCFEIEGHSLQNEKFGFDRRAIIASPVVAGNKIIVGGRDGFLYAVDKTTGKQIWRVDHEVSWIIGAVAIKDTIVVTGTSDGHFVQA